MTGTSFRWARIGLSLAAGDRYAPYYREVLEHAGLSADPISKVDAASLADLDVVLLAGIGEVSPEGIEDLALWLERGGSLVVSGSDWGLGSLIGVGPEAGPAGPRVLDRSPDDRLWPTGATAPRFFGGRLYHQGTAQTSITVDGRFVGACRRPVGSGRALFVAPHVGQTVCQMQLGRSVEVDAIGPADGSAWLDDQKLRAEDGIALDFELDRHAVGDGSPPFFDEPHADAIKEVWIRAIVEAIEASGRATTMVWPWPRCAPAVAMLSVECEHFESDAVLRFQRMLTMIGARPAWLVSPPGYSLDVYRQMRAWDHEVGLLFAGDDWVPWSDEHVKVQHMSLGRAAAVPTVVTIRPVDGRWRGWTQFYEAAEAAGARLSVSKGGRQPGTVGFSFGTCHPFFPLRRDGSAHLIAEAPYAIYMPGTVTSDGVADRLLERTLERGGCLHMVSKPEVADDDALSASLRRLITLCKQSGMPFLLPQELHEFERTRRSLRIYRHRHADSGSLVVVADNEIEDMTLLYIGPRTVAETRGRPVAAHPVAKFGTTMWRIDVTLHPKQQLEVRYALASTDRDTAA
ncbi:MAG: hypothetical protein SNJ74_12065 [Fimbriimonadaceae bacterium]